MPVRAMMGAMLLDRLAATSAAVAATSGRKVKTELLAGVIGELEPSGDRAQRSAFSSAHPARERSVSGWATLARVEVEPAAEPGIGILELDHLLSAVASLAGPGFDDGTDGAARIVSGSRATEREHDFVRRIVIGDLRQGALQGVVTDAVAKAAGVTQKLLRRAVMLRGDLGATAVIALTEGTDGLVAVDLEVGRPIQPMLASTAADLAEAVAALGTVQIEWKLDGARIQVHRDGTEVAIYTRNLNDITSSATPGDGDRARRFPCTSTVLDGEILGFAADEALRSRSRTR